VLCAAHAWDVTLGLGRAALRTDARARRSASGYVGQQEWWPGRGLRVARVAMVMDQ